MNTSHSPLDMEVAEALKRHPGLVLVMLRYHMGCVGCLMASFCTLRSAVKMHRQKDTRFLQEVEKFLNESPGDTSH